MELALVGNQGINVLNLAILGTEDAGVCLPGSVPHEAPGELPQGDCGEQVEQGAEQEDREGGEERGFLTSVNRQFLEWLSRTNREARSAFGETANTYRSRSVPWATFQAHELACAVQKRRGSLA